MKHRLKTPLMIMTLAVASSVSMFAQTSTPSADQTSPAAPMQHGEQHRADPARQTRMLTKRLGLTADQAAQVQPILVARQQQIEALHAAPGTDPKAMRTQRQAIMSDTDEKLNAVFNDEQKQQFAALKAQHHHNHKGTEGAPTPPPPGA